MNNDEMSEEFVSKLADKVSERILDKVSDAAAEKMKKELLAMIGQAVLDKLIYAGGVLAGLYYFWAKDKGIL